MDKYNIQKLRFFDKGRLCDETGLKLSPVMH